MALLVEHQRRHDVLGLFLAFLITSGFIAAVAAPKIIQLTENPSATGRNWFGHLALFPRQGGFSNELFFSYTSLDLPKKGDEFTSTSLRARVTNSLPLGKDADLVTVNFGGQILAGPCVRTLIRVDCDLSSADQN